MLKMSGAGLVCMDVDPDQVGSVYFSGFRIKKKYISKFRIRPILQFMGKKFKEKKWEKLIKILPQTKDRKTLKLKLNQNFIFLMLLI